MVAYMGVNMSFVIWVEISLQSNRFYWKTKQNKTKQKKKEKKERK
jgi:hypothetical protein